MSAENILKWPGGAIDFSSGCVVMGILNVTPDSFSDGGDFFEVDKAVARGIEMAEQGAAIIDVGPESSRPGSARVGSDEQIERAVPVIEKIAANTDVPISIDTYLPDVAEAALNAGASMINDITALGDKKMAALAAEQQVPVVLMHMQGEPATMQKEPKYDDVVQEVLDFLVGRAEAAQGAGVAKEMIFIDPGIGFGKTTEHNLLLLKGLHRFVEASYKVLVGTSRKRFIGEITGKEQPVERIFGTAATVTQAVLAGAAVVRVHDVSQMMDVVRIANRLRLS